MFFNRLSGFLERESHQQKDFPMEKHSEQLQIDQPRKLCCLFHQQNQEPNTANAVDDVNHVIVSNLIDTNKETVPLLPSVDNTENSPKSKPSDVDKQQNNEVEILKNKYYPQHWWYLVLLME